MKIVLHIRRDVNQRQIGNNSSETHQLKRQLPRSNRVCTSRERTLHHIAQFECITTNLNVVVQECEEGCDGEC